MRYFLGKLRAGALASLLLASGCASQRQVEAPPASAVRPVGLPDTRVIYVRPLREPNLIAAGSPRMRQPKQRLEPLPTENGRWPPFGALRQDPLPAVRVVRPLELMPAPPPAFMIP